MTTIKVVIVHGGELAKDVAEQIESLKPSKDFEVTLRCASERPKTLLEHVKKEDNGDSKTVLCFVMQTIENEAAPEAAGSCCRFFKRKTHAADLLAGKLRFAVLALGDSNLLLDRQTTTAKDCNQVGQTLDARLAELGAERFCARGEADERTGLTEVEPWIASLWTALAAK